jgi:hypothetical protein
MTRSNSAFLLRRVYQHVVAATGALLITALAMFSVQTHAATPRSMTPSVTILVPTVTIEVVN